MTYSRWLFSLIMCCALSMSACERLPDTKPTLETLETGDKVKRSGRWLMASGHGLHRLDSHGSAKEALIAVHGYKSEGYEWVELLKNFGEGKQTYFYHWDWLQCPAPAADALHGEITALLKEDPKLSKIHVVSHSYGGLVTALAASKLRSPVPVKVHMVASPLAGHEKLTGKCDFKPPTPPAKDSKVNLYQWRTVQSQDGAFKSLKVDPQILELEGSQVVRLPERWNGRRLGHNWSLAWVAQQLGKDSKEPKSP